MAVTARVEEMEREWSLASNHGEWLVREVRLSANNQEDKQAGNCPRGVSQLSMSSSLFIFFLKFFFLESHVFGVRPQEYSHHNNATKC